MGALQHRAQRRTLSYSQGDLHLGGFVLCGERVRAQPKRLKSAKSELLAPSNRPLHYPFWRDLRMEGFAGPGPKANAPV